MRSLHAWPLAALLVGCAAGGFEVEPEDRDDSMHFAAMLRDADWNPIVIDHDDWNGFLTVGLFNFDGQIAEFQICLSGYIELNGGPFKDPIISADVDDDLDERCSKLYQLHFDGGEFRGDAMVRGFAVQVSGQHDEGFQVLDFRKVVPLGSIALSRCPGDVCSCNRHGCARERSASAVFDEE